MYCSFNSKHKYEIFCVTGYHLNNPKYRTFYNIVISHLIKRVEDRADHQKLPAAAAASYVSDTCGSRVPSCNVNNGPGFFILKLRQDKGGRKRQSICCGVLRHTTKQVIRARERSRERGRETDR